MKESGIWVERMAMENLFTLKERSMMECGDMTRRMAKGFTFIRTEHNIREAGIRICRMGSALNSGQIHLNSQVNTKRVEKMVLESICGLTEPSMRGNGKKMR
jgi:hypothetical protein